MNDLFFVLTLCAALGSGLMAGVFFAFSTFVMRALVALPPAQGIEAMQSINRTVINGWFLGVFFGTVAIRALLAASALFGWHESHAVVMLSGSLLYLIGTFLITVVRNVPMNNALERVQATGDYASDHWARYVAQWTAWNHLRTAAALLGTALMTLALVLHSRGRLRATDFRPKRAPRRSFTMNSR
jgi:uncharacterized membrane protein